MRMRRLTSRRRGNKNTILVAIILIVTVFVCSTGYAFFSQKLDLQGTVTLSGDNPNCNLDLFKGYKDFEVDYEYVYYMNRQEFRESPLPNPNNDNVDVRVTVKITNTGTKTVSAWRAFSIFPMNTTVTNFWNASNVYEGEAKNGEILVYEYPSIYYNNTIQPGQTITFNVDYSTTDTIVEIKETTVYGWDISIENVPELEDMAGCIYNGNSSGGDNSDDGSDDETEEIPNPTYAVLPSTYENSYDGWRASGPATLDIVSTTIDGTTSNALSVSEFAAEGVKASLDLSQFEAGEYTFSTMVSRGDFESIPVEMYYSVDGGELIPVVSGTTAPSQWKTLEGTITIPEGATSVDLYIDYPGTEEGDIYLAYPLYIDNVNLVKETESGGDSGDNSGSESGGETGGDSEDNSGSESGGNTGGDSGDDDPDDNTITSSDGKITASVENRYQQDSDGLSYYATVITLRNNTDANINNWYIKLDVGEGGAIPGCWTATCEQSGGIITITPPTWGVNLEPGNPYTIEFQLYTKQVEPKVIETGILE